MQWSWLIDLQYRSESFGVSLDRSCSRRLSCNYQTDRYRDVRQCVNAGVSSDSPVGKMPSSIR